MPVSSLQLVVYGRNGRDHVSQSIPNPTWDQVEEAVRRLNCFQYPHIVMWATEDPDNRTYDDGELFEVLGGDGSYWLAGTFDGCFQRRLDYPEQGDEEVTVWTSDQGYADANRHICHDIEAVVRAAYFYFEHGGFDPSLKWETGP